jgi:hypothetical protein
MLLWNKSARYLRISQTLSLIGLAWRYDVGVDDVEVQFKILGMEAVLIKQIEKSVQRFRTFEEE